MSPESSGRAQYESQESNHKPNPAEETSAPNFELPKVERRADDPAEVELGVVRERLEQIHSQAPETNAREATSRASSRAERIAELASSLRLDRDAGRAARWRESLSRVPAADALQRVLGRVRVENTKSRERLFRRIAVPGTAIGVAALGVTLDAIAGGSLLGASGPPLAVAGIVGGTAITVGSLVAAGAARGVTRLVHRNKERRLANQGAAIVRGKPE